MVWWPPGVVEQKKGWGMSETKLKEIVENHVPGLPLILTVFAMVEFGILMVCLVVSADRDMVRIFNANNEVVYEDAYNMSHIMEFKKITGIENFQDEGFVITRVGIDNKFPTRAWIALSVCVPLMLILFVVFITKIFTDIFHPRNQGAPSGSGGDYPDSGPDEKGFENIRLEETRFEETRFEKLFSTLGRLNIYSLGSTVILMGFLYWMVPDLLMYLGKISYQTLSQLKWVLLGLVVFGGGYLILKTILSYKTRKEIIRHQADIQKNRDQLVLAARVEKKSLESPEEKLPSGLPDPDSKNVP